MLKEKQIEIINDTFEEIKAKFPETILGDINFRDTDTWVEIIIPVEFEGNDELDDLIAERYTDILLHYGYSIEFHAMPPVKTAAS